MDEYIGVIKAFAGTFAPVNYFSCDGSLLSISQYSTLFAILGTTYGGNGTSNFALPDLRANAPIGITGTGPAPQPALNVALGQKGGLISATLNMNNMPSHTHAATLNVSPGDSTVSVPVATNSIATPGSGGGGHGGSFVGTLGFNTTAPNIALNSGSVVNATTGSTQPQPINTQSPYLGMIYIICWNGVFPTRPS
jgi:microcystin-dependent protein